MRNILVCGVGLFIATAVEAAGMEPLNIKTGLWQVTMTSTISRLPEPNTSTYKSCLKREDLGRYPFADPEANCTWNVVSSTGSNMEADGTCMPGALGKVGFKMRLEVGSPESVSGTGQLVVDGPAGTMSGTYAGSAKWLQATCPADAR
jgi:hypothetical protein